MLNKVMLIGNLGRDPELKYGQSGSAICTLGVATSHTRGTGDQRVTETEWHNVVVFGKSAEACGQYLHKGSKVYVEGRLRTRSWDKDGVKQYRTEILADTVQFLDPREGGGQRREQPQQQASYGADDDIPF